MSFFFKKNKYGNRVTGGKDSGKEYRRALLLRHMQKTGEIKNLREQVKFELVPKQKRSDGTTERSVTWTADFVYEKEGKKIVEDCKGFKTVDYIIRRKLMLFLLGIEVKET